MESGGSVNELDLSPPRKTPLVVPAPPAAHLRPALSVPLKGILVIVFCRLKTATFEASATPLFQLLATSQLPAPKLIQLVSTPRAGNASPTADSAAAARTSRRVSGW